MKHLSRYSADSTSCTCRAHTKLCRMRTAYAMSCSRMCVYVCVRGVGGGWGVVESSNCTPPAYKKAAGCLCCGRFLCIMCARRLFFGLGVESGIVLIFDSTALLVRRVHAPYTPSRTLTRSTRDKGNMAWEIRSTRQEPTPHISYHKRSASGLATLIASSTIGIRAIELPCANQSQEAQSPSSSTTSAGSPCCVDDARRTKRPKVPTHVMYSSFPYPRVGCQRDTKGRSLRGPQPTWPSYSCTCKLILPIRNSVTALCSRVRRAMRISRGCIERRKTQTRV